MTKIPLIVYNGNRLPFKNKTFDTTYASFVFHHCDDVEGLLSECIRVTKGKLIVLEDVYENNLDLFLAKIFDYLENKVGLSLKVSVPFNFKTEAEWETIFKGLNIRKIRTINITLYFGDPIKHKLFLLNLK